MKSLLVKNVKHLVTCDVDDQVLEDVNVLVQDGVISYIGKEEKYQTFSRWIRYWQIQRKPWQNSMIQVIMPCIRLQMA